MSSFLYPHRISPRDQAILDILTDLRLLKSSHITRLAFQDGVPQGRDRRQRAVMKRLVDWQAVHRYPRPIGGTMTGSEQALYTVPEHTRQRIDRRRHTLDVAELYVRLIEQHRQGAIKLLAYHAEPLCHVTIGRLQYEPDAKLHIQTKTGTYLYFLEVDEDTEKGNALRLKLLRTFKAWEAWPTRGDLMTEADRYFPTVVYVVPNMKRYEEIAKKIREVKREFKPRDGKPAPDLFDICLFEEAIDRLCT